MAKKFSVSLTQDVEAETVDEALVAFRALVAQEGEEAVAVDDFEVEELDEEDDPADPPE